MLLDSAKILNQESLIWFIDHEFLIFDSRVGYPRFLPWKFNDIKSDSLQLLKISSKGTHFAFFHRHSESFYLLDTSGVERYSKWINTDRAVPLDIRFSPDGEVVVFISENDGLYRIFLYNINKGYSTELESGCIPFGYDNELRYFMRNITRGVEWIEYISQLNPLKQKYITKNPEKKGYENVTIFDRHGTKRVEFSWMIDWLVLGFNTTICVLLTDEYNLEWYINILKNPRLYNTLNIDNILPHDYTLTSGLGNITLAGDNVLLDYPLDYYNKILIKEAIFLNNKTGVKLKIRNIIPIHLDSRRCIVQRQGTGTIASYDCQGTLEFDSQQHFGDFTAIASYNPPYLNCADIDVSRTSIGISAYTVTVPGNDVVLRWTQKYNI